MAETNDSEKFDMTMKFTGAIGQSEQSKMPEWLPQATAELPQGLFLLYHYRKELCQFSLGEVSVRIGRSLAAETRFDDSTVSRRHAFIKPTPDGYVLLDNRSLNGVCVNGSRVDNHVLSNGDQILIGRHLIFFVDKRQGI